MRTEAAPPSIFFPISYSTVVKVQVCPTCKRRQKSWTSTKKEGQVAEIDTPWASPILVSCSHEAKLQRGHLSTRSFCHFVKAVVAPVVNDKFHTTLSENRNRAEAFSPDGVIVAGAAMHLGLCHIVIHQRFVSFYFAWNEQTSGGGQHCRVRLEHIVTKVYSFTETMSMGQSKTMIARWDIHTFPFCNPF